MTPISTALVRKELNSDFLRISNFNLLDLPRFTLEYLLVCHFRDYGAPLSYQFCHGSGDSGHTSQL